MKCTYLSYLHHRICKVDMFELEIKIQKVDVEKQVKEEKLIKNVCQAILSLLVQKSLTCFNLAFFQL